MTERWTGIDDYPNYEVGNSGKIRNASTGRVLKQSINPDGYYVVNIRNNKVSKTKAVHRLVAASFCQGSADKLEVNHIDGNKKNNRADNLEWTTRSDNVKHAFSIGLAKKSPKSGVPRKKVKVVETGVIYDGLRECARCIDGLEPNISACLSGVQKTHRGYHFEEVLE